MRMPANKLIVAIFGATCTGKSTVAAALASARGVPVRHCGEVLKAKAGTLAKKVPELKDDDHRWIDEETREKVRTAEVPLVVEGGFLDHVLSEATNVILVGLTCADPERAKRLRGRAPNVFEAEEAIRRRDAEDATLRGRLFQHSPRKPDFVLDTSALTIEQCVHALVTRLNE